MNEDQDFPVPPWGSLPQVYIERPSLRHQLEYPEIKKKHVSIKEKAVSKVTITTTI